MAPSAMAMAHGIARHERAYDHGDCHGGHRHAEHDEVHQRHPVFLQISRRRVECRIEEDGRDEQRQCQTRLDGQGRCARQKRQACAAEREKRRIRDTDPAGKGREEHRGEQQAEQRDEFAHGLALYSISRWTTCRPLLTDCLKIRDPSTPM